MRDREHLLTMRRQIAAELATAQAECAKVRTLTTTLARLDAVLSGTDPGTVEPPPVVPPPATPPPSGPPPPSVPPSTGAGGIPPGPWVDATQAGVDVPITAQFSSMGWGVESVLNLSAVGLTCVNNAVVGASYAGTSGKPLRWSNVEVFGGPSFPVKWGMISFDVYDYEFSSCTFRDIPLEHGLYLSMLGGMKLRDCMFRDLGGQGIQMVGAVPGGKRAFQTAQADWWAAHNAHKGEPVEVADCAFLNVGDGERGSYALSAFGDVGNPVLVSRSVFRTHLPFVTGTGSWDCHGAFFAHDRSHVELIDSYVEYLNGDRAALQFWHNVLTVVQGCTVLAAAGIDVRLDPGCRFVLSGCDGTAPVTVSMNDKYVSTTSQQWDESKVLHRGVVTDSLDITA